MNTLARKETRKAQYQKKKQGKKCPEYRRVKVTKICKSFIDSE